MWRATKFWYLAISLKLSLDLGFEVREWKNWETLVKREEKKPCFERVEVVTGGSGKFDLSAKNCSGSCSLWESSTRQGASSLRSEPDRILLYSSEPYKEYKGVFLHPLKDLRG